MLKIKSNTNEFTIIFLRRLERKRMLKRSRSASIQFSTPSSFLLLFFLFQCLFFFLLLFSAPPFVSFQRLLFSFQFTCALFFSPKQFSLQPKNIFFSPNVFQFFSPNVFQFFFSPNVFASAQNLFQFSPHHCFSLFLFCFSRFSFCWFCFQRTFSFCSAPPFLLSFSAPHSLFLANFQGQKYSL